MTYPPPPGGWNDPGWSGQQPSPPVDPALPISGQPVPAQPGPPVPTQPGPVDPYTAVDSYTAAQPVVPYAAAQPQSPTTAPYALPGYPAAPGAGYPGYGYPPAQPKTNGLAVAALILSLIGLTSCITAPVGAILGHVAQKQIRQTGEGGEGMAKAAIIVGWILTALLVLLIIFYGALIAYAITEGGDTGY